MEKLRCVVERITYQNEQNGYSVIKCKAKGYSDLVTVVGAMPEVHVGAVLLLSGEWRMDAKYGRQFSIESFEETLPATVLGIEKYLGSGLVKGTRHRRHWKAGRNSDLPCWIWPKGWAGLRPCLAQLVHSAVIQTRPGTYSVWAAPLCSRSSLHPLISPSDEHWG